MSSMDVRNQALRLLSSGVYVLTACRGDQFDAATVTWVSQASTHPPLVMVALRRNTRLAGAVRAAHRFALNILATDQQSIAERFFTHLTTTDPSSLAGLAMRAGAGHCPLLTDALGWLECRVAAELASPGDHDLILGEVTGAGVRRDQRPMVLSDTPWSYGGLREA